MLQQIISFIITGILTVFIIYGECKYDKVKACVIGAGFFSVAFLLDSIFWLIMAGFSESSGNNYIYIIGIFVSKCILISGMIFLKVARNGRITGKKDNVWQYTDILTIMVSLFFVVFVAICQFINMDILYRIIWLLVLMLFLVVYLISVYVHEKRQYEKRIQAELYRKKYEADIYLDSVENNYQRTRELWHDLKNHINLMQVLLHEQKYDELNDYLRIFNEDVDTLTLPMKSGNIVVDALLSDKLGRAKREGVEVKLSLCNFTELNLRSDEICGLFGNLMDNAIEANRTLANGKLIEIECKEQETYYYIKVSNTMAEDGMLTNGIDLKTTKSDRRNQVGHGLGLRSVERSVHGCGGEIVVEAKRNMFTVVVRLPR